MTDTFSHTLQQARKSRRISQLELALRIGVSQRHVSFVESGRARPSRDLLIAWLHELNAPLAVRNVALQQAGFAAVYQEGEWGGAVLAPAREALSLLLVAHDPMPAIVLDAAWNVLQLNRGAHWLCHTLMPWLAQAMQQQPNQPLNFVDAFLHPDGLLNRVTNLEEVAPALISHLRETAEIVPELTERVKLLAARCQERIGGNVVALHPRQLAPTLITRFATEQGELAFFSMFSTFGTPQDITLASLRVEHMFAADELTKKVMAMSLEPIQTTIL